MVPNVDAGVVLLLVQLLEPEHYWTAGGVVPHVELHQPRAHRATCTPARTRFGGTGRGEVNDWSDFLQGP